jgi:hypothetical protein
MRMKMNVVPALPVLQFRSWRVARLAIPKPLSVAELWSSCLWNGCDSAWRPLEVAGHKKNRMWIE